MATQNDNHLVGTVGGNIAAARKRKRLTQQDVAAALGTSISRVSGWETGQHRPSRRQHQPLADLLFDGDVSAIYRKTQLAEAA